MAYTAVSIDGRQYRYSDERRISGRPASIQFLNILGIWRDVRNVDRSDQIWEIADGRKRYEQKVSDAAERLARRMGGEFVRDRRWEGFAKASQQPAEKSA